MAASRHSYATLADLQTRPGVPSSGSDAELLRIGESVSEFVDEFCRRHFYIKTEAKIFDGVSGKRLDLPDLMSASAVATDTEQDGSFDDETWVENTDFSFTPWDANGFPKDGLLVLSRGNFSLRSLPRFMQITGDWGYGDGSGTSDPTAPLVQTVTITDATTTLATFNADPSANLSIGHTIKVGTEQIFITAFPSSTTATIVRGQNGTTAATHAGGSAVSIYQYPRLVKEYVIERAARLYSGRGDEALAQFRAGAMSWSIQGAPSERDLAERYLGPFRKVLIG